jgi:regulator of PEP synthase PpsR (kinase-PPPase family)
MGSAQPAYAWRGEWEEHQALERITGLDVFQQTLDNPRWAALDSTPDNVYKMYNTCTQECCGGRHNTAQHNISKDNITQRNVLSIAQHIVLPTVDDLLASG